MEKLYYESAPLLRAYLGILENEAKLKHIDSYYLSRPVGMYFSALQILEVAISSHIPRIYNKRYGLSEDDYTYESIGAHTRLTEEIAKHAFRHILGKLGWLYTKDGYTFHEVQEVLNLHDLPENKIGDWPDNGSRDEAQKSKLEYAYLDNYIRTFPLDEIVFPQRILQLFNEMNEKSSPTGRILYMADKVAAIITTLTQDILGHSARMSLGEPLASERDIEEMFLCDDKHGGKCKASEMWTIDHLHVRNLSQYDDSGFFTALIVMYTLMANGHWYNWRKSDYPDS